MAASNETVGFTQIFDSDQNDWDIVRSHMFPWQRGLPKRVEQHLMLLKGDGGGLQVDRLEHCLQSATRAHRDGRDEAYVVMTLLHDIGDLIGSFDHAEIGAAIIRPFVSEEIHWIARHHGIFQGKYFFEYIGLDPDLREQYRDSPYFDACVEFVELYDQNSFDPAYDSEPIEFFRPMLERVLSKPIQPQQVSARAGVKPAVC